MSTTGLDSLPRRITLQIPVPACLSDASITETCDLVASRLRYLLCCEFQRKSALRLRERQDARAARKAARLDAAIREAEAAEADEAKAEARQAV